MNVSGIKRDSWRQFASASSWGVRPAASASWFNVSALVMVCGSHPSGGSHCSGSSAAIMTVVGVNVGRSVKVGVIAGGMAVGVAGGGVGGGEVIVSTLSRVGNESIVCDPPASVKASSMLPNTMVTDNPAARAPSITLLRPNIPPFTRGYLSLGVGMF